MFKRSKFAAVITCAASAMVMVAAGTATAADLDVNVYRGGTAVGFIRHIDDGDYFRVFDIDTDGHGVRGWLLNSELTPLQSAYVGGGSGDWTTFQHNVLEGKTYYMKVCTVDGASDTTPIDCNRGELHE
ncbi:hypothetical protein ACFRAO_30410 [Streptomyces sp. NPDC056656]|uniref:hypothetical protein n=1 Tax=Streptomyces sp. NPDC056656 TaxID=3345895 RepID=UPI0036BD91F4